MHHVFETHQRHLLSEKDIFSHRASNLMNAAEAANHCIRRVAQQGGNGIIFFQQLAGGDTGGLGVVAAGGGKFFPHRHAVSSPVC